ncbi:uncharacterized protein [Eurosta solidaginis]|uniref:uncharacterized protein isoform X2 n=1 Tax=Eurosta solidaginis TaxID=178769 RepID=UPI003530C4ED
MRISYKLAYSGKISIRTDSYKLLPRKMSQRLITLNKFDDLIKLRDIYKAKGQTQVIGYKTLNNYICWFEKEPRQKHIQIYTLPEVWKSSGLFLIVDRYQLMIGALDTAEAVEQLKLALPQLDWSRGYKMPGVPATHLETILKILTEMGLNTKTLRLKIVSPLPPELEFRPLSLSDAPIVNDIWYSRQHGSLEYIKRLITYNQSIGIYIKTTGELIAWCIRCNLGLLGMLHVKDAYRGYGFAIAIIHRFWCQLAEAGEDTITMIADGNTTSLGLFNKLNFKEIGFTYIIRSKRVENMEMWSDELESKEC